MDDYIEQPSLLPKVVPSAEPNEEQSSDEEDGGPDWTKIPAGGLAPSARPVIPKRGEKDFEPSHTGGSALQQHMLDRMRTAMFNALNVTRTSSTKTISYAVWVPQLARAHVPTPRGTHFTSMGHSVPRPVGALNDAKVEKLHKRLELLPEEALYLVERGSMFCWKEEDVAMASLPDRADIVGTPMTVQQAYAEMIGKEDLTLDKYQVFAYLRRLGYVVTRARPPSSFYPNPAADSAVLRAPRQSTWFARLVSALIAHARGFFTHQVNWWKPLHVGGWLHHDLTYVSLFSSLRLIPNSFRLPLRQQPQLKGAEKSPYTTFYHLYKPSTPFRKSAPPPPDFSIVVINARTTPMPTLHELTALFQTLPEVPLPPPRQRQTPQSQPAKNPPTIPPQSPQKPLSLLSRISARLFPSWLQRQPTTTPDTAVRRPNPFQALKFGKKNVIIAVVDAGTTSFFRFGQAGFEDWPMVSVPPPSQ